MTLEHLSFETSHGPLQYLYGAPHGRATGAPLLVFLHGGRDAGDDLGLLQRAAPVRHVGASTARPYHFVAPQLRADAAWTDRPADLLALVDDVVAAVGADASRVVLAGFSLGGTAAWQLAAAHPGRFAGLVAVSARVPSGLDLGALAATPARVFHGGFDHKLPVPDIDAHVAALRDAGGVVDYTLFTQGNHFIDEQAFVEGGIDRWIALRVPAAGGAQAPAAPVGRPGREARDEAGEAALA